ncbi:Putative uncharacterized protein [Moritella viscosa]|uniref:DUF413 domain-containing protein n=1 Tax=Moritella viscosa TaxID=80854 RepID=UPI00091BAFC3|nr:DUF413 domain-containing protein [Moritella viscosa]SGY88507.1 Putative uncharacterized protein [Moritella viscosa]
MRNIGVFLDELHFPFGFTADDMFDAKEVTILENFGLTMSKLQEGSLLPLTAAEHYFLAELDGEFPITSEFSRCWRKYNSKVTRLDNNARVRQKLKRKASCDDEPELIKIADDDDDDGYTELEFEL